MAGNDPFRLIHSTTDLGRAHAIAVRLQDGQQDDRSKVVLEGALLADYARLFMPQAGTSAPIDLTLLPTDFTEHEADLHDQLMKLASQKAEQLRHGKGFDEPVANQILDGLDLDSLTHFIFKLRKAVTCELYPDLKDDPKGLRLMVGPLWRSE